MSLFKSLADIFTGLPPRREQPNDQQTSDIHSPQHRGCSPANRSSSHSAAAPPSRHIQFPRQGFPPRSQLNSAHISSHRLPPNRDTAARLQSAQSYDNDFSPTLGPADTREQLRGPPSQFVIDLSACGSDAPQMFGKNQKRNDVQARQEEARLLGARDYKDKDAVPITPGATLGRRRNLGSFGAFQPTDRISQNARESGPVRTSGKANHSASYLSRDRSHLEDAFDFEESSRPNKRRRRDAASQQLERTEEASVKSGSSAGTASGAKQKSSSWNPRQHEEFRSVEKSIKVDRSPRSTRRTHRDRFSSTDSYDEQFTSTAAQQRRSLSNTKEGSHQAKIAAIEIPTRKSVTSENTPDESGSDRQTYPSSTGTRRVSERGESPDELQGDATTQPIPTYLGERQDHSGRKHKEIRMSPVRKRSPSDIQPTDFAGSSHRRSKKVKRNGKGPSDLYLKLRFLHFGSVIKRSSEEKELLLLRVSQDQLELEEEQLGTGKEVEIMLRHVRTVVQGGGLSPKVRLLLSRSSGAHDANQIDFEFASFDDKEQLVDRLRDMQVKIQYKHVSYMEKSFENSERDWAQHGTHTKRPLVEVSVPEPAPPASASTVARRKLSSALEGPTGESSESLEDSKPKSNTQGKVDGASESRTVASRQKVESDEGVEIPVKKFRPSEPEKEGRTTRRTTRASEKSTARDDDAPRLERQPSPRDDPARKKWKKPLVYPRVGKKKAEVSVHDRDRLRDYEFLNDNLIGFYMRFLQDHLERTNKEAARRIYFFNSYFFDTLTKTPKGERGINYSGVEKWTRGVDLFSYDYIVVPINQDAHWYVAIICNLPSLNLGAAEPVGLSSAAVSDKESSVQPQGEVQEILESPKPEGAPTAAAPAPPNTEKEPKGEVESPESQQTRQSFATMSLGGDEKDKNAAEKDEASPAEEWPDEDENPPTPTVEFPNLRTRSAAQQEQSMSASEKGRKPKKKGKAKATLDPRKATIITFDSLDLARWPTINMLRKYICKEAASKRGVEVDPEAIQRMCAKNIPHQPNYSDCGLYLLAYVEKFVQNPEQFITKLLRGQMDTSTDWPPLGSGLLRHRFRNFLDDLFDEQVRLKKDTSEETKPIMADQQPVSFLLGPSGPGEREDGDGKAADEHSKPADPSKSEKTPEHSPAKKSTQEQRTERSDGPAADQPSLLPFKGDSTSKSKKDRASQKSSTPQGSVPSEKQEILEVPDSQEKGQDNLRTQSESESSRAEQRASKGDAAHTTKSKRKEAPIPADPDIVKLDDSFSNKAEDSETRVQVQVRETPPPAERGRLPKSP